MRLSFRTAKVDSGGRHNDRNFDLSKASHIKQDQIENNKYFTYNGETNKSFREIEIDYYKKTYKDYLASQNERNTKNGHRSRNKTIMNYYTESRTRPEDLIIQVGTRNDHIDGEKLWDAALEYARRFDEAYGRNCKILTMALHMDEETPHIHIRRAWSCECTDGSLRPSMAGALREIGIDVINPSEGHSRINTEQSAFTQIDKSSFRDICAEKGIELEPEREGLNRKYLTVPEYKEMKQDLMEMERTYSSVSENVNSLNAHAEEYEKGIEELENFLTDDIFQGRFNNEIEEARKKSLSERLRIATALFRQEMERIVSAENLVAAMTEGMVRQKVEEESHKEIESLKAKVSTLERRNNSYKDFIIRHDMGETFNEEYRREKELREAPRKDTEREKE